MPTAPTNPIYSLRLLAPGHFAIAKFSMPDFNVEAIYNLHAKGTGYSCDCPASFRATKLKPCKHQRMMAYMMGACNSDRFYDPQTGNWMQPLAPDLNAEIAAERTANGAAPELPVDVSHTSPQAMEPPVAKTPSRPQPAVTPLVTRRI